MPYELGEIMFERDYEIHDAASNTAPVKLLIGKPQPIPEPEYEWDIWYCPVQIIGIGGERIIGCAAPDALAALLLSLQMADANLKSYAQSLRLKITWLGHDDLGLPIVPELDAELRDQFPFEKIFNEFFEKLGGLNPCPNRTPPDTAGLP